ncbi:MAG: hypothetical protein ACKV22_18095, partial [Bryobacteraceae bacterium]
GRANISNSVPESGRFRPLALEAEPKPGVNRSWRVHIMKGCSPAGAALQRSGYAAWSWDRWRAITGEQPPQLTTDQSGRSQLSDLLGQGTTTPAAWTARRVELRRVIDVFLGRPPSAPPPLEARTEAEVELDGGILRRRVRFQCEAGEFIPAYVFLPEQARSPTPAIVCPHQTTQDGKDEPAGIRGNSRLAMALALARRGYVTLSYDAAC